MGRLKNIFDAVRGVRYCSVHQHNQMLDALQRMLLGVISDLREADTNLDGRVSIDEDLKMLAKSQKQILRIIRREYR